MPSVELINGKWVSVDGVKAEDLDGTASKEAPPAPKAAPKPAAKAPKAPTTLKTSI